MTSLKTYVTLIQPNYAITGVFACKIVTNFLSVIFTNAKCSAVTTLEIFVVCDYTDIFE